MQRPYLFAIPVLLLSACERPGRTPVAAADHFEVDEDASARLHVLDNDRVKGTPPLVVGVSGPDHGVVTIAADDVLVYTPDPDFFGVDRLTYTIRNGRGREAQATVTVLVKPAEDPPMAVDDTATMLEDTTIVLTPLANDQDVDGGPSQLTLVSVDTAAPARASIVDTQHLRYTPAPDQVGRAILRYTVQDAAGAEASATVRIDITPVNDPPIARPDVASCPESGVVEISALGNDSDVDSPELTLVRVLSSAHGEALGNDDGTITYTPTPGYNGPDRIIYVVSDGELLAEATIFIDVLPANRPPQIFRTAWSVPRGGEIIIEAQALAVDEDGDHLQVGVRAQPTWGKAEDWREYIVYRAPADYSGQDAFPFAVADRRGEVVFAQMQITIEPDCEVRHHEGDVYVGAFNIDHIPSYTSVSGTLTIEDLGFDEYLTHLEPLGCLQQVGGDLVVKNTPRLQDLAGLDHLERVGGHLAVIRSSPSRGPTSLAGLRRLTEVGGQLTITAWSGDCQAPFGLDGLKSITRVGGITLTHSCVVDLEPLSVLQVLDGDLRIRCSFDKDLALRLDGLRGLERIAGDLFLDCEDTNAEGLANVERIDGNLSVLMTDPTSAFASLEHVGGNLSVRSTPLEDLQAFGALQYLGGTLSVGFNDALVSLRGLDGLTSLGGLFISFNDALASLDDLASLTEVGTGGLFLAENEALTSLAGLDNLRTIGGNVVILSTALTTLDGLQRLRTIAGNLELGIRCSSDDGCWSAFGNAALKDYDGLGGLHTVEGDVAIAVSAPTKAPLLPRLATIGGRLRVGALAPTATLSGFDGLQTVGGDCRLGGKDVVAISGFSRLQTVAGTLSLSHMPALASVTGFDRVHKVGGLEILAGSQLTTLAAFGDLRVVAGDLLIRQNPLLSDLSKLKGLTEVGGALDISNNDALAAMPPIAGVEAVGGDLQIRGNDFLTSLAGLAGVGEVGGSVVIRGNRSLPSLAGLDGLRWVGNDLFVVENAALADLNALRRMEGVGGFVVISGNAAPPPYLEQLTSEPENPEVVSCD